MFPSHGITSRCPLCSCNMLYYLRCLLLRCSCIEHCIWESYCRHAILAQRNVQLCMTKNEKKAQQKEEPQQHSNNGPVFGNWKQENQIRFFSSNISARNNLPTASGRWRWLTHKAYFLYLTNHRWGCSAAVTNSFCRFFLHVKSNHNSLLYSAALIRNHHLQNVFKKMGLFSVLVASCLPISPAVHGRPSLGDTAHHAKLKQLPSQNQEIRHHNSWLWFSSIWKELNSHAQFHSQPEWVFPKTECDAPYNCSPTHDKT